MRWMRPWRFSVEIKSAFLKFKYDADANTQVMKHG